MKKLVIIFLLTPILIFGQIESDNANRKFVNQIQEQIVGFTDRNLYLSGEDVWFSAFLLVNNNLKQNPLSKVLLLELFDRNTKVIARAKFFIAGNQCSGKFQIPPETLSDVYFLRFYTNYQRNLTSDNFAVVPLTIVNAGLTLPAMDKNVNIDKTKILTTKQIPILTDKLNYSKRSLVNLNIDLPEGFAGLCCASVARHGTIKWNKSRSTENANVMPENIFYIPDNRGVSISGFVRDKQDLKPAKNVPVYLSAFGNNNLLHISETQTNGSFLFALNKMEGLANVFISIDPGRQTNVEVLINNDFSSQFSPLPDQFFNIDSSFNNLLTDMLINFETQKIFGQGVLQKEQQIHPVTNLPTSYDFSIRLDDFIELTTLQEIFYEIVPPVSVKSEKSEKYLTVANYQSRQVARAGLIILDNVPVFDVNELLKISPVNIATIDVINRPYYLGDHLLTSIISIKTKTGDFGGYKFPPQSIFLEYQTLSKSTTFIAPDYLSETSKTSRIPDFRTTLYWIPNEKINGGKTTRSFFTSDAKGKYDVVLRAISMEGELIYGTTSFVVE